MSERTEYAVFRFLDQNSYCHKINDVIKGYSVMQYAKEEMPITRQYFFRWCAQLAHQMEQYCKCKEESVFGYVNPYAVIVTENNDILLLDVTDAENEEIVRKMQKRKVRMLFVRKDRVLSQQMMEEDDLYGYGKTIQFMMDQCKLIDRFTYREEKVIKRIVEVALSGKNTGESVWRRCRREFGKLEKNIEYRGDRNEIKWYRNGKIRLCIAGVFGGIVAAMIVGWRYLQGDDFAQREQIEVKEETIRDVETTKESVKAITEAGLLYFVELKDDARSCEILELVAEDFELVNHYISIIHYLQSEGMDNEKKEEIKKELEDGRKQLERVKSYTKGNEYLYKSPFMEAYGSLDTDDAWEEVIRIGEELIQEIEGETESDVLQKEKEVRGYLAAAYIQLEENEKAIVEYERIKELEEENDVNQEEIYWKLEELYTRENNEEAVKQISSEAIECMPKSVKMWVMYLENMLANSTIDRQLCAEEVKKGIEQVPELVEDEGFLKMQDTYGIVIEGEEVQVGK